MQVHRPEGFYRERRAPSDPRVDLCALHRRLPLRASWNGADGLPPSDVLQFFLKDGTVVSARPSGTEPKIKFYASCHAKVGEGGLEAAKAEAGRKLKAIKEDIQRVIG